jgi:hypothetical protein
VSGSFPKAIGRLCVLTLLGMVGLAADARPARAQGCHVPERPTLGFSTNSTAHPFDIDALRSPTVETKVQVIPRPCSGDLAGVSAGEPTIGLAISASWPAWETESPSGWILALEASDCPLDHPSRIDRPPRGMGSAV